MVFIISSIPKLIYSSYTNLKGMHEIQYPKQSGYLLTKTCTSGVQINVSPVTSTPD